MSPFDLPASLLVLLFTTQVSSAATRPSQRPGKQNNSTLASTGRGSQYASACAAADAAYQASYTSWSSAHQWVENQTQVIGGSSWSRVTYYENGTTLCDGHARVPHTPAVALSSAEITYTNPVVATEVVPLTYFSNFPGPSPTCSIEPSDCDPLWVAYSSSSSAWRSAEASGTLGAGSAQITAPPQTPPCMNQTVASSWDSVTSSLYGCGLCTIYGQGVELVYFPEPTTVSRDMCASTPLASQTYYGDGAVIEAYAGTAYGRNASRSGGKTAVVGQNTFTSGTAYISIATVYAEDRCFSTRGAPVYNAILAMPSASVLSLRYSQDHFKWAAVTATQTGYPVAYADFNNPVPWSAWNGQAQCNNEMGGYDCDVVYEDHYTPQLAIPPEINQLNAEWSDCQLWYGGLYDPPLALQPAESIAQPTVPGQHRQATTGVAAPSSAAAAPTVTPTALPEVNGPSQSAPALQGTSTAPAMPLSDVDGAEPAQESPPPGSPMQNSGDQATTSQRDSGVAASAAWTQTFTANSQTWTASACGAHACIGPTTLSAAQPAQTLPGGLVASYNSNGLAVQGRSIIVPPSATPTHGLPGPSRFGHADVVGQTVVTIGTQAVTVQRAGESGAVAVVGSATLVAGGAATTLQDGQVLSAGHEALVVGWSSDVRVGVQTTGAGGEGHAAAQGSGINGALATLTDADAAVVVSALPAGVVIDGSSISLPTPTGAVQDSPATTLTINGIPHTISQLTPGVAIIDGSLTLPATGPAATSRPATLTLATTAYALTPLSSRPGYLIAGQTLTPGGKITLINSQVLSLQPNGAAIIIDGTLTETLASAPASGLDGALQTTAGNAPSTTSVGDGDDNGSSAHAAPTTAPSPAVAAAAAAEEIGTASRASGGVLKLIASILTMTILML
ncbi:hypothetical protein LTR08_007137 [Meristemomyces frigidus]|nr:hypothetical protein LTR08_007137 [Meristemomyces frigidus]